MGPNGVNLGQRDQTEPDKAKQMPMEPLGKIRGDTGPNGAKQGKLGSNLENVAKQGQPGLNDVKRGQRYSDHLVNFNHLRDIDFPRDV